MADRDHSVAKFEEALLASLDAAGNVRKDASEQLSRLNVVVSRYRGQSLDTEPVAAELVDAVLRWIFGIKGDGAIFSSAIVSSVTRSIVEDPAAYQRLTRLWNRLCEEFA